MPARCRADRSPVRDRGFVPGSAAGSAGQTEPEQSPNRNSSRIALGGLVTIPASSSGDPGRCPGTWHRPGTQGYRFPFPAAPPPRTGTIASSFAHDVLGALALQLRLGAEDQPMPQHRRGDSLDILVSEVVPAIQQSAARRSGAG